MGNCFALSKPKTRSRAGAAADKHRKVLQVVKMDGKILEFTSPMVVKDLLVNFLGLGVAASERANSQLLPLTYELKIGMIYYHLPSPNSTIETGQGSGVKRIKVIITKQQLQELLSKQISVKDVLSAGLDRRACSSFDSPSTWWKPKLEPIPEGNE